MVLQNNPFNLLPAKYTRLPKKEEPITAHNLCRILVIPMWENSMLFSALISTSSFKPSHKTEAL